MTITNVLPMLPALEAYDEWKRADALRFSMYEWADNFTGKRTCTQRYIAH
jgi:hypothetical protein